ncbi:hypothetical protein LCGC14_2694620 [marine sediment metagenome]|uniref:Uncharacterized protein n=1 Tax=marine sediment metagenome TaxID=412755 RepID=A0A0F8ZHG4_9ZZZZ
MNLNEYQKQQQDILYNEGKFHQSHDMFIDLDDMWRGCLSCKASDSYTSDVPILEQPCKASG